MWVWPAGGWMLTLHLCVVAVMGDGCDAIAATLSSRLTLILTSTTLEDSAPPLDSRLSISSLRWAWLLAHSRARGTHTLLVYAV